MLRLKNKRNIEFMLEDNKKREKAQLTRPMFDKDATVPYGEFIIIKFIVPSNVSKVNMMMAFKVRGEMHTTMNEEDKNIDLDPKQLLNTILPYGEPSKSAPNVSVEECLKRRKDAKKYLKQRRAKLQEILKTVV